MRDENFMKNRHQLAVAVGLAAGQCRDFNFIPARPGGLDTTDLRRWLPAFFLIVFAFVLFTMYTDLNRSVARSREILQMRKAELATLSISIEDLKKLTTRRDALKQQLAKFPDIPSEQPRFPEIFLELTGIFPDSISLKRIIFQQQKSSVPGASEVRNEFVLRLEGIAFGEEYVAYGLFNQIGEQLNKSNHIQNVSLESSEKILSIAGRGEPGVRFVFKCLLDQAAFR
jgi:hypothetical protein